MRVMKICQIILIGILINYQIKAEPSVPLKKGVPAPFSGVLLNNDKANEIKQKLIEKDRLELLNKSFELSIDLYKQDSVICEKRHNACMKEANSLSTDLQIARQTSDLTKVLWFGGGVLATILVIYGVKEATR